MRYERTNGPMKPFREDEKAYIFKFFCVPGLGRSGHPIEKDLSQRAESGWDGKALKKAIMTSQQERAVVRSMSQFGTAPNWNFGGVTFRG
jgi:hypothetical protein